MRLAPLFNVNIYRALGDLEHYLGLTCYLRQACLLLYAASQAVTRTQDPAS